MSAKITSPSLITFTHVSGDTGRPDAVKNVSKYRMNELTFVRRSAVDIKVNEEEKSSWRGVISLRTRSYGQNECVNLIGRGGKTLIVHGSLSNVFGPTTSTIASSYRSSAIVERSKPNKPISIQKISKPKGTHHKHRPRIRCDL